MFAEGKSLLRKFLLVPATALALAAASFGAQASYTSITVFGDSLSDGGNDFLYTGSLFPPLPYAQRFSNGPTAVEVLAERLGLPLAPSLAGGSNYAYGGAETGTGNYLAVNPGVPGAINAAFQGQNTGTLAQVQSFSGSFGADSLVVLWTGPNDLFTSLTTGRSLDLTIAQAMDNLVQSVFTLYGMGARDILMPNMPDIGSTPFGLNSGDPAGLTQFTQAFNTYLDQTIDQLSLLLSGIDIIKFDTFALLNSAISNPSAFGLSNVTESCLNGTTGTVCADPDQYLFWDSVHPTAAGHRILGAGFYAAVPEPGTIMLLLVSLAMLAASRRRRH